MAYCNGGNDLFCSNVFIPKGLKIMQENVVIFSILLPRNVNHQISKYLFFFLI